MDYIENFVKEKSKEGKLYLSDVYEFLKTRFNIAIRTYQWQVSEGLLPESHTEGRLRFYTSDEAIEVLEKVRLIRALKEYSVLKFSTIKTIFDNYKESKGLLIDRLSTLIEEYPTFERGVDPYEPVFSWENAEIVKRVCEKMKKGGSPTNFANNS